jgi:hypothetical protein
MTALRARLDWPIEDRRRAFAIAAAVLLVAAVALSALAAPPDHRPAADQPVERQPALSGDVPRSADAPPATVGVARRFLEDYLDHLYGTRRPHDEIAGASAGLRRQLARRPVRVTPGMRRHRPRLVDVDLHRLDGGWLADGEIAAGNVSFEIAVVVADRPGGPVVTRLVED